MSQTALLASFATSHKDVIFWVEQQLTALGLVVRPSFDLQAAKSAHADCTCPYHGTANCDCQIVVLLVYGEQEPPITLVVHSRDEKTFLSLPESPDVREEKTLAGKIAYALRHHHI